MVRAAKAAGLTVIGQHFHSFSPHGVTGVVVLAESHISIHTWPELGFGALDLFACGQGHTRASEADLRTHGGGAVCAEGESGPWRAVRQIERALLADCAQTDMQQLERGRGSGVPDY